MMGRSARSGPAWRSRRHPPPAYAGNHHAATTATAPVTTTPVTIEQAAALMGVSASTIRRRIRAGALQVEETRRPQGTVWLVHLPPGVSPAAEAATVDTAPVDTTATAQPAPALAQAEAMTSLIQTTIATVLGPLVAELAASRQQNERQGEQLVSQAGTIGRLEAQLEAERAKSTLLARTAPEPVEPPPTTTVPVWRTWVQWVTLALATAIIGTALLLVLTR